MIKYYQLVNTLHSVIIIICYIYVALFWILKALLHIRGESPQPPPMCSIHLDDATAAILCQNAHHTPAYWWRGDRVMKPISLWGLIWGYVGQRPIGKYRQDTGVTPLLFFKGLPGIFNDRRESGTRFNVSYEGWCFLQYSVRVTILGHYDPHRPQGEHPLLVSLTPSSCNLVFPGGLPSRYWPAQPCLASVGNQSWAAG